MFFLRKRKSIYHAFPSRVGLAAKLTAILIYTYVFCIIIFILFLVLSLFSPNHFFDKTFGKFNSLTYAVVAPININYQNMLSSISDLYDLLYTYEQNNSLKIENAELKEELNRLSFLEKEISLKNDLVKFSSKDLVVRVANKSTTPTYSRVVIDAGAEDNVKENDVVTVPQGLVGTVQYVHTNHAEVILLIDPASRIPVVLGNNHQSAVAYGNGTNILTLHYVNELDAVQIGEPVYTSNNGLLLPAGLLVGRVVEKQGNEILVKTEVPWHKLWMVKVKK